MTRTASTRSISPKRTFSPPYGNPLEHTTAIKAGLPVRIPRSALLPTYRLDSWAPVVVGLAFAPVYPLAPRLSASPAQCSPLLHELYQGAVGASLH